MQIAVKNWTKSRNRHTQQTQSRQPPDNDKMIDEGKQQNHAQSAQKNVEKNTQNSAINTKTLI